MKNPFQRLTRFERMLYLLSLAIITGTFLLSQPRDYSVWLAAVLGVTSLIFIAKGEVLGQALMVVFSVFYGAVSWYHRYYGEVLTYLGMTAPMAVFTAAVWLRHPFQGSREVEIRRMRGGQWGMMLLLAAVVTGGSYFVLRALETANLALSTVSVATSFCAVWLTLMRSSLYAVGYALNDLVLVALWMLAAGQEPSCLPMAACFLVFFVNDSYGFVSWRRMERRQLAKL